MDESETNITIFGDEGCDRTIGVAMKKYLTERNFGEAGIGVFRKYCRDIG